MAIELKRKTKLEPYLSEIGTIPDAEVAAKAGVSAENVRTFRKRHDIPAGWRGETTVAAAKSARGGKKKQTRAARKPKAAKVAAAPAVEAAAAPTAAATTAPAAPAPKKPKKAAKAESGGAVRKNPSPANRQRRPSALDAHWDKLGKLSDREVANLAGVTAENVRAFRKRHGIISAFAAAAGQPPIVAVTAAPAAAPRVSAQASGSWGWQVVAQVAGVDREYVILAASMPEAAEAAAKRLSSAGGELRSITRLGEAL